MSGSICSEKTISWNSGATRRIGLTHRCEKKQRLWKGVLRIEDYDFVLRRSVIIRQVRLHAAHSSNMHIDWRLLAAESELIAELNRFGASQRTMQYVRERLCPLKLSPFRC